MKRNASAMLCLIMLSVFLSGCGGKTADNITFTGVVEEVYDGSILVSTNDSAVSFDKASVNIAGMKKDFDPEVGQTLIITILPKVAESYPVQVTAVSIELVQEYEGDPEKVSLQIKEGSVSPTGLILIITDKNEQPFTYGEWFELLRKEGGQWDSVPITAKGDYGFNDIGLLPDENGVLELETGWEWLYGALPSGDYRILKSIWTPEGTLFLSADFQIEQ